MRYARVQMNSPAVSRVCQFVAVVTLQMLKTSSHRQPRNHADRSRPGGVGREVVHRQSRRNRAASQAEISQLPLRTDTRTAITDSRSIEAIEQAMKRPERHHPIGETPDFVAHLLRVRLAVGSSPQRLCIPNARYKSLLPVAASPAAMQQTKRPPERPAASEMRG